MKDTKKEHNSNNIVSWIFIFILLASAIATIFNYIDLKNPTIQVTAVFIAEIIITVVFMLIIWLDSIQRELYNINNSLYDIKESFDDLYDLKQINGLRSTVNKRHLEKLLNDIEKTINETYIGGKINEESKY
jgi:myosin-crossreactive antigen